MRRKCCVLLPAAGKRTQYFHLMFFKPGRSLLAESCNPLNCDQRRSLWAVAAGGQGPRTASLPRHENLMSRINSSGGNGNRTSFLSAIQIEIKPRGNEGGIGSGADWKKRTMKENRRRPSSPKRGSPVTFYSSISISTSNVRSWQQKMLEDRGLRFFADKIQDKLALFASLPSPSDRKPRNFVLPSSLSRQDMPNYSTSGDKCVNKIARLRQQTSLEVT